MPDQYFKINVSDWQDTGYPFELASVMTYCSYCSGIGDTPVATLHDGSTFYDGERLTTTDALQIQNKYCKMKDERKGFDKVDFVCKTFLYFKKPFKVLF